MKRRRKYPRRISSTARVLTERGVITHADLMLAALLGAEHGRRHPPGAEPRCPKCQEVIANAAVEAERTTPCAT